MSKKRNTVLLTNSEQNVLHSCPWKHHLKFELGLEPAGGRDAMGALNIGTLIHYGIAEVYRTMQRMQLVAMRPTKDQLHAVVRETLAKKIEAARATVDLFEGDEAEEYAARASADEETAAKCLDLFVEHIALPRFDRYAVLGVEVPFRVPMLTQGNRRSGDMLEGVMDIVLLDRQLHTVVLGENKSTASDAHTFELKLATDPQLPLYLYALERMFGPELVKGAVVLNVIRKSYPREPKLIKDGTISVAECDTTQDIYREALAMQVEPEGLTKARAAYDAADPAAKSTAKLAERLSAKQETWATTQQKQQDRADSLPGIDRFVSQHEDSISMDHVRRAANDTWNSCRVIRLYRRGTLTPWRNGSACMNYNRLCSYHDACTSNETEAGNLLVERSDRHPEVTEAREQGQMDLDAVLRQVEADDAAPQS